MKLFSAGGGGGENIAAKIKFSFSRLKKTAKIQILTQLWRDIDLIIM